MSRPLRCVLWNANLCFEAFHFQNKTENFSMQFILIRHRKCDTLLSQPYYMKTTQTHVHMVCGKFISVLRFSYISTDAYHPNECFVCFTFYFVDFVCCQLLCLFLTHNYRFDGHFELPNNLCWPVLRNSRLKFIEIRYFNL